jgi:hypothetical protein
MKQRLSLAIALLSAALLLSGCITLFGSISERARINEVLDQFEAGMLEKDADKLAKLCRYPLYFGDYDVIPYWEFAAVCFGSRLLPGGQVAGYEITNRHVLLKSSNSYADADGTAVLKTTDDSGEIVETEFRISLGLHKDGDTWKIYSLKNEHLDADVRQIYDLLNLYEEGIRTQDPEKLADLCTYPLYVNNYLFATREAAVQNFEKLYCFEIEEYQELWIKDRQIKVRGTEATVQATLAAELTDIYGGFFAGENLANFQLVKTGESWLISNIFNAGI